MKIPGEFVPLSLLIPSLANPRRLYFLYRTAAETGRPGARARFQWFRQRLSDAELARMECIFEIPSRKKKPA